jgi:hypothetical protein
MSPFALVSLRRTLLISVAFLLLGVAGPNDNANRALLAAPPTPCIHGAPAGLPLSFEPNLGQADPSVKFLSRGRGYTLFLTKDQAILRIEKRKAKGENELVHLRLVGGKPDAEVTGRDELPGKANYFIGNDPKKWRTHVPTFAKVRYLDVYPGVDLEYYGNPSAHGKLEYDFIVAPGADPSAIALRVGAVREPPLRIDADGDLVIPANRGEIRLHKPLIYQPNAGSSLVTHHSSLVQGRFILDARNRLRFLLGPYDHSKPLVIDPVLSYSTYLGGSDMDYANGIAVDASGNAYVTGYTASVDFPVVNAAQSSPAGGTCSEDGTATPCFDAFVSKLNSTGTALLYSTYLGGSDEDYGASVAVDSSGRAYVAGYTYSTDFPVQNALQPSNAGGVDAFVAELSADGASLIYSTYWGGSQDDVGTGIAVDSSGNAYLSGYTDSSAFPVSPGAFQTSYGGGAHNGFVVKFNSGGAQLGYSTLLGGSGDDYIYAVAVDSAGDAYVTGATNSTNLPTLNAFQPNYSGGQCGAAPNTFPRFDAFVAKLNPTGSALLFSTYLGGTGSDYGYALALDSSANAYITGYTTSQNFPTTPAAFQRVFGGAYDVFVAKLSSSGSALDYSTYLGGSGTEVAYGIAVDSNGSAYTTGYNYGGNFPTANPVQAQNAGFYDAFVNVLDPTGSFLIFSTYLGGSQDDFGRGIALDPSANVYAAGATFSPDFATTAGSFEPSYMGGPYDAFVIKFSAATTPIVAISPLSYAFGNQAVGTASSPTAIDLTNNGGAALAISSITASGDFSQTSNCGASLAPGASCTISVTFTPTATGSRTGSLVIIDNANPATQTVSLSGTGTAPAASLSPTSLTFSSQALGTASSPQTLTLKNTGTATLTITSFVVSGDFSQTNTCGSSVAAGASCSISVTFKPTCSGLRTGTVTITDNASPATQTASLTGTGAGPGATFSSSSLTFATQAVGTSSSAQTLTLKNTGTAILTLGGITISGDFSQTHTCGTLLAVGASCSISVTFKPTASGTRTGVLTVSDNAVPATQTVSLTGTGGGPAVSLSPASLTFASQAVGTSSSPRTVTLKNTGTATLAITSIAVSGDFSQTNTCGSSVAAGASCSIAVTFKPVATGIRTGAVTITDNATPTTQTVSLTGTGAANTVVKFSPPALTFAGQTVGTPSGAQSVSLSNTGGAALSIASITASGDASQTNDCGPSVAVNASCTLSVTFNPTAAGARTAAIVVTDTAEGSPQTIALTGTGEDFAFAAPSGSSTSATVSPGGTATYALSVLALGGFNQKVVFACTGAPSGASCTVSPASTNLSGSASLTVSLLTAAASGLPPHNPLPRPPLPRPWFLLTMALLASGSLAHAARRQETKGQRGRMAKAALGAMVLVMLALAACGGGGGAASPQPANSGTPAGTYSLAVTGTCASCSATLSHSTTLTLTVQ